MDFALKLLSAENVEKQSSWYGKKGMTFHAIHALMRLGEDLVHHTFSAFVQECPQDSSNVSAFVDHALHVLKANGTTNVFFRSDCAGLYKNAPLVYSIELLCKEIGLICEGYFFSEAQDGKGSADRQISHVKNKLKGKVDGGGKARTVKEVVHGLIQPTLLKAHSFHEMELDGCKNGNCTMNGITSYGTFKYEDGGIRVWRHAGVGPGLLLSRAKLERNTSIYDIKQEGGFLNGDGFWGDLKSTDDNILTKNTNNGKMDENGDTDEDDDDYPSKPIHLCPDTKCTMKFLTFDGVENHLSIGQHQYPKTTETITDAAVRLFANAVECNTDVVTKGTESLIEAQPSDEIPIEGFALYKRGRSNKIIEEVSQRVEEYFWERRNAGKRADAREIAAILKNSIDQSGRYEFSLRDCLTNSQAQTQINKLLKVEESRKALPIENKQKPAENNDDETSNGKSKKKVKTKVQIDRVSTVVGQNEGISSGMKTRSRKNKIDDSDVPKKKSRTTKNK